MPGVRINHLLASTAVVLLLAGAPAVDLGGTVRHQRHGRRARRRECG